MPEDTYLDEVRSGKVGARWALKQLQDELPTALACLTRVRNVVDTLGHEAEATEAQEILQLIDNLRENVRRLEQRQMVADKEAYRKKLADEQAYGR